MFELLYQGHSSFRLTAGNTVVYIDPFAGSGYEIPADYIVCSHEHGDHCAVDIVEKKPECVIFTYKDLLIDGIYQTIELAECTIKGVPAYNKLHSRNTTVGFLITAGCKKFYFAADTSLIPEMKELADEKIDYAFFPTDGFYNMGPAEAEKCAALVQACHNVAVHTCSKTEGIFKEATVDNFNPPNKYVMRPGNTLNWES